VPLVWLTRTPAIPLGTITMPAEINSGAQASMTSESAILKQNPLLINKIVAERLSDKLQIMMVPADGKFFFTNDVLRGMGAPNHVSQAEDVEGSDRRPQQ